MIMFDALPLKAYSSLHKLSLLKLIGIATRHSPCLKIAFNFNLHTPLVKNPRRLLECETRDTETTRPSHVDFSVQGIKRWRLSITSFKKFDDYLQSLKSNYRKNYVNTMKAAANYPVTVNIIDSDWSQLAEKVYALYLNVAKRRGAQLYDQAYFHQIAKDKACQLICLWHESNLVGVLIIYDEAPTYHSMLLGFDYEHSSAVNAYSLLHYELIRHAIESGRHTIVDAGITADKAKSMLGLKPIDVCMDISSRNWMMKYLLRLTDALVIFQPSAEKKIKWKLLTSR